jgi:hypothetical protein
MKCVINPTRDCNQMDKQCEYPKEYDKAVNLVSNTIHKCIPLGTMDYDCDECLALKKQLACIILGDLIDNGIQVKSGNSGILTPVK